MNRQKLVNSLLSHYRVMHSPFAVFVCSDHTHALCFTLKHNAAESCRSWWHWFAFIRDSSLNILHISCQSPSYSRKYNRRSYFRIFLSQAIRWIWVNGNIELHKHYNNLVVCFQGDASVHSHRALSRFSDAARRLRKTVSSKFKRWKFCRRKNMLKPKSSTFWTWILLKQRWIPANLWNVAFNLILYCCFF